MEDNGATIGRDSNPSPKRTYVNHLDIDFSLAEVCLNIGQLFDADDPPRISAKLVTSPAHLMRFNDIITDTCVRYRAEFGNSTCPASSDPRKTARKKERS